MGQGKSGFKKRKIQRITTLTFELTTGLFRVFLLRPRLLWWNSLSNVSTLSSRRPGSGGSGRCSYYKEEVEEVEEEEYEGGEARRVQSECERTATLKFATVVRPTRYETKPCTTTPPSFE